jgi:hypothetical protein
MCPRAQCGPGGGLQTPSVVHGTNQRTASHLYVFFCVFPVTSIRVTVTPITLPHCHISFQMSPIHFSLLPQSSKSDTGRDPAPSPPPLAGGPAPQFRLSFLRLLSPAVRQRVPQASPLRPCRVSVSAQLIGGRTTHLRSSRVRHVVLLFTGSVDLQCMGYTARTHCRSSRPCVSEAETGVCIHRGGCVGLSPQANYTD